MLWLKLENPDIDWEKKTIVWRKPEVRTIETEPFEQIKDLSLVISLINGKMTPKARRDWKGTRMAHSALFHEAERQEEIQQQLVISLIDNKLTDEEQEEWLKTRMSHSQRFGLEEEKKKMKPKEEIVPPEFRKYLNTVFSEREVGRLPP